ncbi:helix-turn-helix domain-containing protein [Streptomyces sp. NBC_00878]|uniref:nSTAND1 domain-containing NTPase n=1 Tax=Streptomyces sp. NBC_00878 TaxID=2975854 RepID=UPI00224E59E5|nr:helix-turn-helix domain-containing protein [Streptomyces sp. NBC_00878]MCX4905320.1 helix-turn-helix domain-containing protein [Streptomyces sp. NBC_00878]
MNWGNAMHEETGPEDFGAAMRRIRDANGVSLSRLAKLTAYSKSHLSNVENGRKRPHRDLADVLDTALNAGGALRSLCEVPGTQPGQRATPCPYRGLDHYRSDDARWFFGRARATTALVDRVARAARTSGPVVVFGASGSGKSSLLRAGLLPAVAAGALPARAEGPWRSIVVTPTGRPVDALARALQEPLATDEAELARRIRAGEPLGATGAGRLLLVVDQFEEAFTLCEDEAERAAYIDAVCALPLAVLAVRADYFDRCLTHPALVGVVQRDTMALGAMSREELAECVTGPAALAGVDIEPGLLDVLLHDLDPGGQGYEPGTLPLLSYALLSTWRRRTGKRLTVAGYRATGGIQGAVAATAERTYLDLTVEQRDVARQLTLQLVRVGEEGADSRRRVARDRLVPGSDEALEAFTRARLFTVDDERVEITHEALLRAWPRLAGWIDADRAGLRTHQRLTEAARAWADDGRNPELLLQGAALAVAEQWSADHPGRAGAVEREFLAAGRREAQRGLRRLRRALAALAGLMGLVLVATGIIAVQWQDSRRQARTANAIAMAERVAALRTADPALAALLSVAAHEEAPRLLRARGTLLADSGLPHPTQLPGNGNAVSAFAFGRDGLVAIGTREGVVRLWDRTGPVPRPLGTVRLGAGHAVWGLAFAGDGRGLVVADTIETRLWRVSDDGRTARAEAVLWADGRGRDARVSPDGRTLALACADGGLRLWDLTDPAAPGGPVVVGTVGEDGHGDAASHALYSVSFSRDGSRLAAGAADGRTTVWARAEGRLAYRETATVPFRGVGVSEAALSPDGRRLAIGLSNREVWLCALDPDGRCAKPVRAERAVGYAAGMAFSPDGSLLAIAGDSGGVQLREAAGGLVLATLPHPTPLQSLAWTPEGRSLFVGGASGGVASVWLSLPLLLGHAGQVYAVALDDRHARAATASLDGTAALWDVRDPARPRRLGTLPHPAGVSAVAFDPSGTRLATGSWDGTVSLWNVTRPAHPDRLDHRRRHQSQVNDVAFSPDGNGLASGARETGAVLWDVSRRGRLTVRARLNGAKGVQAVAHGLGGALVATAEADGLVRLWDARGHGEQAPVRELTGHTGIVTDVAFAAGGGLLASGGKDGVVLLRRINAKNPGGPRVVRRQRLLGHTGHIAALAFASRGRGLMTAGVDGVALLWDVGRPEPVVRERLESPGETFDDATVSGDGRTVLTADRYTARLWTTDTEAVTRRVCATITAPLSRSQWERRFPGLDHRTPCFGDG